MEVDGKRIRVKTYRCRNCGEEFTDLDIMKDEASKPKVNLSDMNPEERMEFIKSLYKKEPSSGNAN